MTRVVVEITDHNGGASTGFKTMTVHDEYSSDTEKRWMNMLTEHITNLLRAISVESLKGAKKGGRP